MAPRRPKQPPISTEWAQLLIGLSMKVPENWWVGGIGFKLHDGEIDSFDISSQKWNLLLDARDEPFPFLMAYDAMYEYVDEDSSTYHEYQLTYDPVLDGDDEIETEVATYTKTTSEEWNQVSTEEGDGNGHAIDPIECTVDEDFSVNITDEEVELLTGFRLWRQYWRQYLGYIFFGGIFPSKMGRFAPFLATIQALSRTRGFLLG
jgi:hypothetical protein